ncbi:unnamed protein product (macronuclear) [Paramecium tetraurelia]|uniref:Uncharacterized protein n=1 Tax=Paramecium tetraurelia TaxID=5888 RepID=A0CRJ9_PARTE|nr:uncharacterized protein GSPATT00009731001 [Paramecium tetraurelia]CAK73416.1 unnamed protein product [Paramecium tetraurelia]|eukprot:XP_001440813.1 hypothetical protein (macronuclear) [Paramecium tetraurelia strain d4-2]
MKNESESRVSIDNLSINKATAPLVTNYKQLVCCLVKQMLFDLVIPGQKMFTEDKKQNLRNQILFYQQGFARNMNDEQAYSELILLSTSSPQFIELLKMTCFSLIGQNQEIEAQVNKELNRSISSIETFSGNIKMIEKNVTVNWSTNKQKLYSKTVIDIIMRGFLLSYILEIIIRSSLKQDFTFNFSITIEYNQCCLEKEVQPSFMINDQTTIYEFKFYKQ